jgi:hypothetical protein
VSRAENELNPATRICTFIRSALMMTLTAKGAGTASVAFVVDKAEALGLTAMQVDHWVFNARARSCFEACGLSQMKVRMGTEGRRNSCST